MLLYPPRYKHSAIWFSPCKSPFFFQTFAQPTTRLEFPVVPGLAYQVARSLRLLNPRSP